MNLYTYTCKQSFQPEETWMTHSVSAEICSTTHGFFGVCHRYSHPIEPSVRKAYGRQRQEVTNIFQ